MATINGVIRYRNVIASSMADRTAFDGSVPYSISCSTEFNVSNTSGSTADGSGEFCLIGALGEYVVSNGVFPSAVKTGLARQCVIRLRDFWVEVKSPSNSGRRCVFNVATYDPTSSFPDATAEHAHLYTAVYEDGVVKIPTIDGLVLSAGLNIGFRFFTSLSNNDVLHLNIHCVADIDD